MYTADVTRQLISDRRAAFERRACLRSLLRRRADHLGRPSPAAEVIVLPGGPPSSALDGEQRDDVVRVA
jgi:hypothetical protein